MEFHILLPGPFLGRVLEDWMIGRCLSLIFDSPQTAFPFVPDHNRLRPPRAQFMFPVNRHHDKPVTVCFNVKTIENAYPLFPALAGSFFDLLFADFGKIGLRCGHRSVLPNQYSGCSMGHPGQL
jgi:hypothetical protein